MVKKIKIPFKFFLLLFLIISYPAKSLSDINTTLNSITTINYDNLQSFNSNVINNSAASGIFGVMPSSQLATDIFNKTQQFYDARSDQSYQYLTLLEDMLYKAKNLYCFTVLSTRGTTIGSWYSTVSSEIQLYANFPNFLKNSCTTALNLTTNVVSVDSYNKKYYQDYPSTSDSIYSRIYSFCYNLNTNLQDNINFLQDLLNLLNAATGKKFFTTTQQNFITSSISSVSSEKSKLDSSLTDFKNKLSTYKDNPAGLYTYVIQNSLFSSRPYLQNYPSAENSIYTILKNLYENRESKQLADKNFLMNFRQAIDAAKTKAFLTDAQKQEISAWASNVFTEETDLNDFPAALTTARSSLTSFQTFIEKTSYNKAYFQNYPTSTNNIYAIIKGVYGMVFLQNPKQQSDLTIVKNLLTSAYNKNFLTPAQNADIATCLTSVNIELSKFATTPTFTFNPSTYGQDSVVFNSANWVAPAGSEGNFAIKFKARGKSDIYILLSPTPNISLYNAYNLNIGGNNNTSTSVRNFTTNAGITIGSAVSSSNALITGGLPGDGSTWDDYWVKIENNEKLSFGKSAIIGTNQAATWNFSTSISINGLSYVYIKLLQNVKYVGLGGYNKVIEFAGIEIEPLPSDVVKRDASGEGAVASTQDANSSVKNNFATDLANAITIDKLLTIINNSGYNQTYLQNYPSTTNSIYTKLKAFFDNRLVNYWNDTNPLKTLPSTITALQNLIDLAKTKNFLTGSNITEGQKKDLAAWSSILTSEKNLLSSFDDVFTNASTMNGLQDVIQNQTFNNMIFVNYPSATNSIFTKLQNFATSRTLASNNNTTYYTNLKNLLMKAKDKNFFSDEQTSIISGLISTVGTELNKMINQPKPRSLLSSPQKQQSISESSQRRGRGAAIKSKDISQSNRQSQLKKIN